MMQFEKSQSVFNQLLDVDAAHNHLAATGAYERYLPALLELINKADLAEIVGVALLHRHFSLRVGEVLVQSNYGDRLVARPERPRECMTPSVFRTDSDAPYLLPVEYLAGDRYAQDVATLLAKHEFLEQFSATVQATGHKDFFGLSTVRRFRDFCAPPRINLEESYSDTRESVCSLMDPGTVDLNSAIHTVYTTHWLNERHSLNTICAPLCSAGVPICFDFGRGKHNRQQSHDRRHERR